MTHAILLVNCFDRTGLVAALSQFVHQHGGNIIDADQHSDELELRFYMRLVWDMSSFGLDRAATRTALDEMAKTLEMNFQLLFDDQPQRLAIFCSKDGHCLHDLIMRQQMGEIDAEIAVVISNHEHLRPLAEKFDIRFEYVPVTADHKADAELQQRALLRELDIRTVVLARYMQILSADFLAAWPHQIINIHHSFLPAFAGARPYHQAKERGVKIIGATAHYVTEDLDEGPIIEQNVCRVSHRDTVSDMIRKGRDLERQVLAQALRLHLEQRVLCMNNRTIIFS